jgi:hypothetical protein
MSAWHAVSLNSLLALDYQLDRHIQIYSATVTFYCQPQHLQNPPKSLEMTILFAALIYVLVQVG